MASALILLQLFIVLSTFHESLASRRLTELLHDSPILFQYHNGALLSGDISVNLLWYGSFKPSQKAIITDFITSLSTSPKSQIQPSVATWWNTIHKYYSKAKKPSFRLGKQVSDPDCSLGKSLTDKHLIQLAAKAEQTNAVSVVLTADDVAVVGFCSSRCGTHGSSPVGETENTKSAYIWVGNSETQCPGQCAWPFHQPVYGPQGAPLIAPNNDVGLDGMVINLASLAAAVATNPFGNGYYQGDASAPLEAASACVGMYGKGSYPGYAGDLLVDSTTGASYNAHEREAVEREIKREKHHHHHLAGSFPANHGGAIHQSLHHLSPLVARIPSVVSVLPSDANKIPAFFSGDPLPVFFSGEQEKASACGP
ncbi:hypothetical protein E3N88_23814 [Mikania micrantha]|uniref:Uncharacterized protein n=1 Tax=Mikania micrantha TaxID=192012 RepID=A0A5N6NG27_9ASTR|nr:hypothetical protein E3N88_23814 [Mikania micrantha]